LRTHNVWRSARLLAIVILATGGGLTIFAPLSLHIYMKHGFPLLAAPIWLAKAVLVTFALRYFWRMFVARRAARWVAALVLVLLIAEHTSTQVENIRTARPMDTSWIRAVAQEPDSSYVVTWIADSVAAFSKGWVAGILAGTEDRIEQRLHNGARPFEFSDYFLFGERDLPSMGEAYLRPDRFLYLITDRQDQFDSPDPACRRNPFDTFMASILPHRARPPNGTLWTERGKRWPPGSYLAIGGQLDSDPRDILRIELRTRTTQPLLATYNCIYKTFVGIHQIPSDSAESAQRVDVTVIYRDGREFGLGQLDLSVDRQAPRLTLADLLPWSRHRQKDVDQFVADNPALRLTARGPGFALFDARALFISR
jgi:hypothetical protein